MSSSVLVAFLVVCLNGLIDGLLSRGRSGSLIGSGSLLGTGSGSGSLTGETFEYNGSHGPIRRPGQGPAIIPLIPGSPNKHGSKLFYMCTTPDTTTTVAMLKCDDDDNKVANITEGRVVKLKQSFNDAKINCNNPRRLVSATRICMSDIRTGLKSVPVEFFCNGRGDCITRTSVVLEKPPKEFCTNIREDPHGFALQFVYTCVSASKFPDLEIETAAPTTTTRSIRLIDRVRARVGRTPRPDGYKHIST